MNTILIFLFIIGFLWAGKHVWQALATHHMSFNLYLLSSFIPGERIDVTRRDNPIQYWVYLVVEVWFGLICLGAIFMLIGR